MDKAKLALLVAGIALIVGGLGLVLPGQPTAKVVEKVVEKLGAFPGSDFGNCISQGGVRTCTLRVGMNTASSTLCVLPMRQFGLSGTSTLLNFSAHITTSATGAFLAVLDGNRPNLFAPALSVATSSQNIASWILPATMATGSVISVNATSSLVINSPNVLGASSSLVLFAKNGADGTINQGGTGRVIGGDCIATVQDVSR